MTQKYVSIKLISTLESYTFATNLSNSNFCLQNSDSVEASERSTEELPEPPQLPGKNKNNSYKIPLLLLHNIGTI